MGLDEGGQQAEVVEAGPSLTERMEVATAPVAEPSAVDGQSPSAVTGGDGGQQQTQDAWQGVREYARAQGVELPHESDVAALNHLLGAQRQLAERNYYAELGQRLAPHADGVREYLASRQRPQAPAAPPAYQPPPFKKEWLGQVERDEGTGALRSKPGYDPGIAEKVSAYVEWREKFLESPETVIAPLVETRAAEMIERRFADHQQRSEADRLVQSHQEWLFQRGADGREVYDNAGRRQMTPLGVLYARTAKSLWDSGVRDVRRLDAMATMAAENAILRLRLQGQGQPTIDPRTAGGMQPPVGGGTARPGAGVPAGAQPARGMSLREMLIRSTERVPDDVSL